MNEVRFTLTENARLAPNVYRLRLAGDASAITAPGQFLEPVSYTHLTLPTICSV